MKLHRATLKEGDNVVLQDIQIYLDETTNPRNGLIERRGSFDLPRDKYIDVGMYRIILNDGRQGNIIINSASIHNGTQSATFVGSGEFA